MSKKWNEVAAAWWADKIASNSPKKYDIGYSGKAGEKTRRMIMLIGTVVASENTAKEEKVERFKEDLAEAIVGAVEENSIGFRGSDESYIFGCDYGPMELLSDIADKYGISYLRFPFKTYMKIKKTGGEVREVAVKDGYGQGYETIWKAD